MDESRTHSDDATASPRDEPLRHAWVWGVYVLLYGMSIPWYLTAGQRPTLWFGLPSWIVISFFATASVSVFTVFVIRRYWTDDETNVDREGRRS